MITKVDSETAFLSNLMIAISNCSLYSKEHEAFDELAKRAYASLNSIMADKLELMVLDNDLIINNNPFRKSSIHKNSIIKRLRKKRINRVDFHRGITLSELKQLIIDLSQTGPDLKACPHIAAGTVDVAVSKNVSRVGSENEISDCIEKIREIFHAASPAGEPNVTGLEEVVGYFVASLKREANVLKLLNPIKSYDEYTYTHAANVAVLSIFQAETLGVEEELLHEIGVAAMLHDTGKMFISKEILEKPGKLDDGEFEEIKKHPLFGAKYLARMDNITRLAPLVAFEHHMKYDNSGYPSVKNNGRRQHIISQIAGIADFFDALRSNRPYRAGMEVKEIFVLMRKCAGTDFNPFLVEHFMRTFQQAIAA